MAWRRAKNIRKVGPNVAETRGVKVGTGVGRMRKDPSKLSQHPKTVSERKRKTLKTEEELIIDRAKARDRGALSYQVKKLKNSEDWQQLSKDDQAKAIKKLKDEVADAREAGGRSGKISSFFFSRLF